MEISWPGSADWRRFLWTLVLVALLFAMLAGASRPDGRLTANLRSAAELEAVADGAIHTALSDLLPGGPGRRSGGWPSVRRRCRRRSRGQSGLAHPNTALPGLLAALLLRLGAP